MCILFFILFCDDYDDNGIVFLFDFNVNQVSSQTCARVLSTCIVVVVGNRNESIAVQSTWAQ